MDGFSGIQLSLALGFEEVARSAVEGLFLLSGCGSSTGLLFAISAASVVSSVSSVSPISVSAHSALFSHSASIFAEWMWVKRWACLLCPNENVPPSSPPCSSSPREKTGKVY